MLNRIIILGNSLSIPRPDDQVDYVNTYPYILVKSGYEVINRSRRINDIEIQSTEQNMLDDVDYLRPDYVVIHLGIVECAPRIFSKKNYRLRPLHKSTQIIPIITPNPVK